MILLRNLLNVQGNEGIIDELGYKYFEVHWPEGKKRYLSNEETLDSGNFKFEESGIALPWYGRSARTNFAFILKDMRKLVLPMSNAFDVL